MNMYPAIRGALSAPREILAGLVILWLSAPAPMGSTDRRDLCGAAEMGLVGPVLPVIRLVDGEV